MFSFQCYGGTQLLAVFTATMAVMSDGMHYGWSSAGVPKLQDDDSPVGIIDEDEAYWIEALYWIGGIVYLPLTVFAVDKLGRKGSVILASLQNLISWIMVGFAPNLWVIYIARFLSGAASNTSFVAAPMYIAECADPRIRGFLGTSIYTMMMVGTLIIYSVGPFVPIWVSSSVGATINIIQIAAFCWMPETPYYCLLKKDKLKAESSLRWLRGRDDVQEELASIGQAVERQSSERGRPKDLFLVPSNRKAILVMTLLNCTQHFCGISVMLMNVQMIISESGSPIQPQLSAILFGVCMLVALFTGGPLIDRFGRKALLITSSILSSLTLGSLGSYFLAMNLKYDPSEVIPLIAVLAYAFAYRMGLGLVPIVMTGEIFPTSVKGMGMALADLIYNLMAIVSIKVYYATSLQWGRHVPFLIFAAFGILAAICSYLFVPETKGKTLEEIQMKLKRKTEPGKPFKSRKTEKIDIKV